MPPRHHGPCSSFDDHARARLTSIIHGDPACDGPIHDRGSRSAPYLRTSRSSTPHACERPSCDDSSHTGSLRRGCARPAIRGMFACLSTLIRVCRTAPLGPCTSSDAHVRARCAARTPLEGARRGASRFRSRSVASGSARIFRFRASGPLDGSRRLPGSSLDSPPPLHPARAGHSRRTPPC